MNTPPMFRKTMTQTSVLLSLVLAGCGVETAGTAATVSALKAAELKQGQKTTEQITRQIDAANHLAEQRAKEAEGK
jgi:hypothetical protein